MPSPLAPYQGSVDNVFGDYSEPIEIAWRYQSYIQLEINP